MSITMQDFTGRFAGTGRQVLFLFEASVTITFTAVQ